MTASNGARLTTRHDFHFLVRPIRPGDEQLLADFYSQVSKTDLRFRYLNAHKVSREEIVQMTHVDHRRSEDYIAFADGQVIAHATLACDAAAENAEVAIAVHRNYKNRGVGWTLLDFVSQQARARGIRKLQSIESRENHATIGLERDMGFTARALEGEPSLVVLERVLA